MENHYHLSMSSIERFFVMVSCFPFSKAVLGFNSELMWSLHLEMCRHLAEYAEEMLDQKKP